MAKVSICIPAYNNEKSVQRLLESVEIQNYKDYEVIITDDSDKDQIKKLAAGKPYISYHKNEQHLGAAANWNKAITMSRGEYIKIMHHDDWFTDEGSLQEFVKMLDEHPEADIAFSGTVQVENGISCERFISGEAAAFIRKDYKNLFLGNTIGAPSAVMVRRYQTDTFGNKTVTEYDERLKWLVDMDYYMQLLSRSPDFIYTESPLVSVGVGQEQLTVSCRDDRELNIYEYGYIFKKFKLAEKESCKRKLMETGLEAGKSYEEFKEYSYGIEKKEYNTERRKKFASKINWKISRIFSERNCFYGLALIFAISLIPILMLSSCNYATGDDLGYSRLTHEAWLATHSLVKVMQAAGETVGQYYHGWQGTWFSVFLFTLQPEVFAPWAYIIVPALMLTVWLGTTGLLLHCLLVEKAGLSKYISGMIYLVFAAAGIQFVPSTKSSIFWYNGAAHYIIPYGIALLAIYFYLKYMDGENRRGTGQYIGLLVCMALLGGVNYQAALLSPMVIILVTAYYWNNKKSRKKAAACILPIAAEAAGLFISMKAPGNKVRAGEDFELSIGQAVKTVFSCFIRGVEQACSYIMEHPLLILFFVTAAASCWIGLKYKKNGTGNKGFPHPVLFVSLSFCVYCAMFAPEIYAGVEVSGGVPNMNYYIFLFMVFGDMIYVEGALYGRFAGRNAAAAIPWTVWLLPAGLVFLICFRGDARQTTALRCIEYISSGQAADFKSQMKYQRDRLLDHSLKEVILPQVNDQQGPLMHMPLTEDEDAWTNQITRDYYGKTRVVALPQEQWIELQGQEEKQGQDNECYGEELNK